MQLYLVDGARLRLLRERASLSQEELSEIVGRSETWVEDLERQSRVHVLEILVQRLTRALGVEISDLTSYPGLPDPPTAPEDQVVDVQKLRVLREKALLSREQLDELAELEPGSVASAESVSSPAEIRASVDTIWKLAQALEVSPTQLIKSES